MLKANNLRSEKFNAHMQTEEYLDVCNKIGMCRMSEKR